MREQFCRQAISAFLVSLVLLGAFLIATADTVAAAQDGDYIYTVSGGTATITGYNGTGGAITIPSTLDGYTTVAIGDSAFNSDNGHLVTSVTIPSSVTSIGNYTFSECTSLTSVAIPNSVMSIGEGSFAGCTSLTSMTIPDSVISIGDGAFQSCTSLTSMTIPDNVTTIGDFVFGYCTSLTTINVSAGNPNYASVDGVLYNKAVTNLIQCPGGMAGTVTIPNNVTTIGDRAFDSCASMTSMTIPRNVTSIGDLAFYSCTSLTAFDVNASNANYASVDGVLYNKAVTNLIQCPGGMAGTVTIPNNVTSIRHFAFADCASLTSLTIPNNVTTIGDRAFDSCASLASVTIGSGVTSIEVAAFYNCSSLTSVTIPDSVTSIGIQAFAYCSSLTFVTIGSGVTSIEVAAFYNCSSLTFVTIGSGVTSIGYDAFGSCISLASITFLGLVAPTTVDADWILDANVGMRGHAYSSSNFPAPGSVFNGLMMGAFIPSVPSAPTNLSATPGNAQVSLNWTAPTDDGGSVITGYRVYRSTTETGTYSLIASPLGLNFTNTGLTNGQAYWYNVSAVNAAGEGAKTIPISSTPFTVPNAPTGLLATPSNAQVTLNWTAPAFDGGSVITGYRVYRSTTETGTYSLIASPSGTNYTDAGRINGQTYWYNVSAVNAAGEGIKTALVTSVPFTVPNSPTGLTAIPNNAQVTLNWTAPAFNGGSVIDYYVVYRDGVDVAHPAITTVSITGLTNGQAYSFTVAVHNAAGLGAQSGAVSSMPFTVPNSPTGLTAIPNNAQVTLNWTAPAFDGGSVITGYRVYRSTTETGTYSLIASPSGTNYTDAGRINGQTYWYNVSAVNAAGEGIKTALVTSVPFTVPNSPTGLTATPGNGLIDLNWTVPSYVGIGFITYNVFRDGIAIYNGPEMNYRDSGLAKGALHSYTVAARNSAGWGLNCTAAHSAATGVPDAPRGLTAAAGDRRVDLNWTVPSYLGPGTLAYHLFRNGSLIWSGSEIIYTDTNVTNGFSYTYNVAASNSLGWGGNSSIALTAPIGPPSEPTGMTAIAGDERVNLTWTVPAYWGPGGITYHLFRDGGEIWSGTVTSYNDTSLINGITYAYSVSASNPLGWGPNSTAVLATPFGVPDAPWGLSAISGNAQASLSWNSVNYSGPGTLTYHLFRDGVEVWSGTAIYYEDAGLSNGQAYEYTLAASNSIGWSLNSSSVSVTPQGPPSYPRGLVAEAGNGVAELNWTTPSYSGPGVLIYHLFRDGVEVWNGTELGYVDASLTNFVSYSYAVAAQNSIGWGPNSTAVQATPLPSEMRPTSPRNLVAMPGNENVTMTWDPPEYSNSSAVSGYMISFGTSPGSMSNQITWNQLVYVLDGLAKGQTYYFKVSAQNSAGWGPNSSVTSAIPFGIPDTPRGLDAVPGNAQVVLNWSAPSYTGPWTVTYRLFRDQVMVWSGTAISHTDSGLTNGQEYTYQISAGNSVGWGPNTTSMTATPLAPPMPPGVPTRFHVVEGDGQVILNWTAPSQSGSSPLTGYKLYRSNTYGSTYILIAVPSGLTYTDAGLTNGQTYLYKVSAVNAVGEGVQCSVVSAAPQGATTDNTIPYVGIAIAAIVGIAIVVELMSRRK